jgi:hypothetical protein
MTQHRRIFQALALGALLSSPLALTRCGADFSEEGLGTDITFTPARPVLAASAPSVEPYAGDDVNVKEAQDRFRTGLDLHRKVVTRTCSPNGGVCHNRKEYPDLHTPANFLGAIGAYCNVQPGEETSVYDGCERTGDRFRLGELMDREVEIGHLLNVPGEYAEYKKDSLPVAESPGLHIYLHDPVPGDRVEVWTGGKFIRTFVREDGEVQDIAYATYETRWWVLDDRKHLFAEVRDYQQDRVNNLLAVGIVQGDANRNGVFGARQSAPIRMLMPGKPEESYLIARLRGTIGDDKVPGSRMPLANQPLSVSEMLALFCFVEGLPPLDKTPDLTWPIDYKNCSYSRDPENLNLLGEGVTWERRIRKILEANCGGCHGGVDPSAGLNLLGEGTYERLISASEQKPELKLIEPGDPSKSYLWLKLQGDPDTIVGAAMPIDPLQGTRKLTSAELGDIQTWITNGAVEDQ